MKGPSWLAGLGLLVSYSFSMAINSLVKLGNIEDQEFLRKAYLCCIFIVIIANCLFVAAVLKLPRKKYV